MSDRQRALQLLKSAEENAVDNGWAGVMVVATDGTETITFPEVSKDVDPRMATIWMLGAHIQHVVNAAESAGGGLTMEQAARDAIAFVREHGDAEEAGI